MTITIKSIAWVGTGNTGLPLLTSVADSNKFDITLLVRKPLSDYAGKLPQNVSPIQVDFTSHTSLVSALRGKDAVVVVISFHPWSSLDIVQIALINAAIEAGVKYFIPSEWAPDTSGAGGHGSTLGPNSVVAPKRVVHNYLLARQGEGKIAWTVFYVGVILENCMKFGMVDFNFKTKTANLPDGGIHPFSSTTLVTIGKALVAALSDNKKVKNRFVHIADGVVTQQDLVRTIEKATGEKWTKKSFSIAEGYKDAEAAIKGGTLGIQEFFDTLRAVFFSGMTVWKELDNEILGITEEDRVDLSEEIIRLAKV